MDLSGDGLVQVSDLLRAVFPSADHLTPEYLDRLYNGNPLGETFGLHAFDEGQLVGHVVNIPIKVRVFGKEELGIWPFQLATRPGKRNRGLFQTLMSGSADLARERGYGHLFGVANAQSTPIMVKKLGYQCVRQLDVRLTLGTAPAHRPGKADLDLERIWDAGTIRWRLDHPAKPYRVQWRGDRGHLYAPLGRYGIWIQVGAFPRALLPDDLEVLRGAHPFRLWVGVDPTRDWSKRVSLSVPQRFWPSPLYLMAFDLTDQGRRWDPDRVRYEIFDFDAY